jgi:predicted CXXCH cytochrome family protein
MAVLNPGKKDARQVADFSGSPAMRAMDCVACHVEHRGPEALVSRTDEQCLQCHQSLKDHVAGGAEVTAGDVTSSFPLGHPQFGRRLRERGVTLAANSGHGEDALTIERPASMPSLFGTTRPTTEPWLPVLALKFKHARHVGPQSQAKISDCTSCHTTMTPDPRAELPPAFVLAQVVFDGWKPWRRPEQLGQDGPRLSSAATRPAAGMQPVRYEQHCRSCHPIGLPITPGVDEATLALTPAGRKTSVPAVAHDRMEIVRAQLSDVDRLYFDLLSKLPQLHLPDAAGRTEWAQTQKASLVLLLSKNGAKQFFDKQKLADFEDAQKGLDAAAKALKDATAAKKDAKVLATLQKKRDEAESDVRETRAALLQLKPGALAAACEVFVAATSKTSCSKCHYYEAGNAEGSFKTEQYASLLSDRTAAVLPQPLPTGLDSGSHAWFTGARFDHDKHRDTSCLYCHAGMDGDEDGKLGPERYVARMPLKETCAQCHVPDAATARGAGADCLTCHAFHDRAQERSGGGRRFALPWARPAVPLAGVGPATAAARPAAEGAAAQAK